MAMFVLSAVLLGFLGSIPAHAASVPNPLHDTAIQQQLPKGEAPLLSVVKHVDKNQTELGGSFTITIIIFNYSNKTAYNVTVQEPTFPSWAFDVIGPTEYRYDRIEPQAEQVLTYVLVSKTAGNFTLESTKVVYYDSRDITTQRQFTSVSNVIDLTVLPQGPNVPGKFQALYEAVVTLLLIFVVLSAFRLAALRMQVKAAESSA